jgi:hypothetical protein
MNSDHLFSAGCRNPSVGLWNDLEFDLGAACQLAITGESLIEVCPQGRIRLVTVAACVNRSGDHSESMPSSNHQRDRDWGLQSIAAGASFRGAVRQI